jgi:AcrR family transcriptional regulator
MTDKQTAILKTALELFSKKGFDAVSTNLIAKEADVSEGLIFRHFQNKMGLLQAIMQMGKEKVEPVLKSIAELPDSAQRVHAIMELPFHIGEEDYAFWRLIYSLKWQNEFYDDEMSKPTKDILVKALTELKYADADAEADLIMSYVDGFATTVLLKRDSINTAKLLETLRKKYKQ